MDALIFAAGVFGIAVAIWYARRAIHEHLHEMRRTRDFVQSILNAIPDPIFVKDSAHRWIHANEAFSQFLGRTSAEYIGKSDPDIFPPEMTEVFWARDELVLRERRTDENEEIVRGGDGQDRVILTKKTPTFDAEGNPILVGVMRDITARKQEETRLKLFQTLFDQASDSTFIIDPVTTKFHYVNGGACENLGYTREELLARKVSDIESLTRFTLDWPAFIGDIETAGGSLGVEGLHRRKDGESYPVALTINLREFDGRRYLLAVARNIKRRKENEERLRYNESYVRAVIDAIPGVVMWIDRDLRYIGVNQYFASLFGRTPADFIGRNFGDVYPPARGLRQVPKIREFFAGPDHEFEAELEVPTPAGPRRYLARIHKFDEDRQAVVIGVDITEKSQLQVEIEQARMLAIHASKLSGLGEMASGIAHEINNPLAILLGRVEKLERRHAQGTLESAGLLESLTEMKGVIGRISKIIEGLRTVSRDSGRDPVQPVPLSRIVDDALALFGDRIRQHAIEIRRPPVACDLEISCRPSQIGQILLNLFSNAFDAIETLPERWICVEWKTEAQSVVLSIADSGPGIPPEIRAKLMQPFFTTKQVGKGTGLGLSISRRLAESHGGTLELDPTAKHTTFRLRLPRI